MHQWFQQWKWWLPSIYMDDGIVLPFWWDTFCWRYISIFFCWCFNQNRKNIQWIDQFFKLTIKIWGWQRWWWKCSNDMKIMCVFQLLVLYFVVQPKWLIWCDYIRWPVHKYIMEQELFMILHSTFMDESACYVLV